MLKRRLDSWNLRRERILFTWMPDTDPKMGGTQVFSKVNDGSGTSRIERTCHNERTSGFQCQLRISESSAPEVHMSNLPGVSGLSSMHPISASLRNILVRLKEAGTSRPAALFEPLVPEKKNNA
jgi:hypothetical protein